MKSIRTATRVALAFLCALTLIIALSALGCGEAKSVGDACTARDQCPGVRTFPGDCAMNFPNGYCTHQCVLDVDCGQGAFCVTTVGGPVCVKQCTIATECRIADGYSCTGRGSSGRLYCNTPGS